MLLTLTGLFIAASAAAPGVVTPDPEVRAAHAVVRPYVEVWTNREVLRRGEGARVYFRAESDAHVFVFRVDTDGAVDVLFPAQPWDDTFVRGSRRYEITTHNRDAFYVDDFPGQGYVVIVASREPFYFGTIANRRGWAPERELHGGRVAGDPYLAIHRFVRSVTLEGSQTDTDIRPYFVEQRYEYPRFLCYDCHAYTPYSTWDPYTYSCIQFRVVIQDDPYYYPARYHDGTRVVYQRPDRVVPRYVLRDRRPGTPYVSRESRLTNGATERTYTSSDIGGRGAVAPPDVISSRRRITGSPTPTDTALRSTRTTDTVFVERSRVESDTELARDPERRYAPDRRLLYLAPARQIRPTRPTRETEPAPEEPRRRTVAVPAPTARSPITVPTRRVPSRVTPRGGEENRRGSVERRKPDSRNRAPSRRTRRPDS